jgi:hypothetical protein
VGEKLNEGALPLGADDPRAAYGVVARGDPLPPMVDFRGHDGRFLALPYGRLVSITLVHDSGVELEFPEYRILVRGRNLGPLYEVLVENRVTFVQEGDMDFLSEAETFVDSIVVAPTDIPREPSP